MFQRHQFRQLRLMCLTLVRLHLRHQRLLQMKNLLTLQSNLALVKLLEMIRLAKLGRIPFLLLRHQNRQKYLHFHHFLHQHLRLQKTMS
jgi:hypothetical protein